jgi:hypothetical protein
MLLSLPRELRDMIIDRVLLTPDPAPQPTPSERPEIITSLDEARLDISPPPIPPFRCNLAEVCTQIRAETSNRIPKLQIPLVLDVLGLENGSFRYTWLSRPWGPPSKWGRIPQLTVQIRTRPVDVRFWPIEKLSPSGTTWPPTPWRHYLRCSRAIISMLLGTIRQSIISIIQASVQTLADGESAIYTQRERASAIFRGIYPRDPHDPCWCKEQPQWPNMLAHVRMEITSALDGADVNITISQELQEKYLQISDISLSEMIVRQWRRNRAVLFSSSEEMLENRACLIHGNPVLTHVGSLSLHCDIANTYSWDGKNMYSWDGKNMYSWDGTSMYSYELEEDIEGGYCTMSDGYILPVFCIRGVLPGVKRVRKELGWGKSETVEKKAEEGRR